MRIVSGKFRSRVIQAVPGMETRPTLDKIKQSIFNQLGQTFWGGRMLDLFAGSGNIGLEALSRGMEYVIFVDVSRQAIKTIQTNVDTLQVKDQCQIIAMDYKKALEHLKDKQETFDLIYLDPPYLKQQIHSILEYVMENKMLRVGGRVVCESLKEDIFMDHYDSLHKIKDNVMGITRVTIYERK